MMMFKESIKRRSFTSIVQRPPNREAYRCPWQSKNFSLIYRKKKLRRKKKPEKRPNRIIAHYLSRLFTLIFFFLKNYTYKYNTEQSEANG